MSFKKIYWIKNFETDENMTFSEDKISFEKLSEYNDKGFNIYQTVNTFIGDRRLEKDLAEIKSCFIDIDYPQIITLNLDSKQRAEYLKIKYENEVIPKLKEIKDLYELEPNEINVTYKGFHILFHYEASCFFIDSESHKEINNTLNEILGGDENARDLARVYKVPGFVDWKYGNKGKIKSILNNTKRFITLENIKGLFSLEPTFRKFGDFIDTIKKIEVKSEKKNKNIEKINNIDSVKFLEELKHFFEEELSIKKEIKKGNSNLKEFNEKELKIILNKLKVKENTPSSFGFLEEDGVTKTSGLLLELDGNGIWKINDYSKKTRRGNYNFLKNWILSDKKIDFSEFIKIIYKTTSLTLNSNIEKKSQMSSKLLWDDHYSRFKIEENKSENSNLKIAKLQGENKEVYEKAISEFFERKGLKKVFRGLFIYIFENFKDIEKTKEGEKNKFFFPLNDFLEQSFGLEKEKDKENHRKYIKELLLYMSGLTIPIEEKYINPKGIEKTIITYKHIFEVGFEQGGKGKGDKELLKIELLIPLNYIIGKPAFTNKQILLYQPGFKDTKITELFIEIDDILNNTNHTYSKDLQDIFNFLEYKNTFTKNKQNLKKHLNKALEKGFFKSFKLDKEKLYVYKYNK